MSDAEPQRAFLARPSTWGVVAGLVVLLFVAQAVLGPRDMPLPAYFEIPRFTLVSQAGTPFGTDQLAGKAWIAGFFFTRCPTVCPILVQRQSDVERRTRELGDSLRFVTISIDPDHDTPAAMSEYGAARRLPFDRWTLLTGRTEEIQQLVRDGFKE